MRSQQGALEWAAEEFGAANLGDKRRTRRLVGVAGQAARRPAGTVTSVFETSAEREGAYRLLEKQAGQREAVARAAHAATLQRASGPYVMVPVDGSALSLPAAGKTSDFGPVGNCNSASRGLCVMSAIAVSPESGVLGPVGQSYWARPKAALPARSRRGEPKPKRKGKKYVRQRRLERRRKLKEKETCGWLRVMEGAVQAQQDAGYPGKLWFQLDRGGDCWATLAWAAAFDGWLTVRANNDRCLIDPARTLLWDAMQQPAPLGVIWLEVPRRVGRPARDARLEVRAASLLVQLNAKGEGGRFPVPLSAVHVREVGTCPKEGTPIEWMLLTTRPVNSFRVACEGVDAYAARWSIEEVHKTWKSIARVEDSALRSAAAFSLWATLLFSVSARIERLKHLQRTSPQLPASQEFSPFELQALLLLKRKHVLLQQGLAPTLHEAVTWIAELGGYTGKSSGGPPGSITIGRGLERIKVAADVLSIQQQMKI